MFEYIRWSPQFPCLPICCLPAPSDSDLFALIQVLSCSPIYSFETTKSVLEHIEATLYKPFETMESLLMSISPMFQTKFQEALYNKLANINGSSSDSDNQQRQENLSQGNQQPMSQEAIIALLNDDSTAALGDSNWNIKNI